MPSLKDIVERHDIPEGRMFDLAIQALIVLTLLCLTVETVRGLPPVVYETLHWIELASIAIFSAEYLLRLYVATPSWRYPASFWGIIDLLAILPYYLGMDLRWARALRLLRLLKLARYSTAIDRFRHAFVLAKSELLVFGVAALVMLYVSAAGIYFAEHEAQPEVFSSIPASLWWAVVTLTTVGYGDTYPVTTIGRIFTGFVVLIGVGIVAGFTGVFTSALARADENNR